jgi:hypothetical protein
MAGRKRQAVLVGFGLATLLAAGGIGALGVGCGGGNSSNGSGSPDGSMESSVEAAASDSPADVTPVKEGGSEAGDGAVPQTGPFPRVFLVHASPNLPPVRFCFGVGDPTNAATYTIFPFAALPDSASPGQPFPAVFPGTGGEFKNPVPGVDLGTLTLTLYVVNAQAIASQTADGGTDGGPELTCDQLIPTAGATGSTFLTPNTDFWQLNTIPAHTLMDGMSYVEAITGCLPGLPFDGGANSYCGAGYSTTTGNVGLTQFALDTMTTLDAGSMGVQFAQASTPWAAAVAEAPADGGPWFTGGGVFTVVPPGPDAGPDAGATIVRQVIAAPMSFGNVTRPTLTPFSGLDFTSGASGAFVAIANIQQQPLYPPFAEPFPLATALTYGANPVPDGGAPQYGKGYAFVLLGDPLQDLLTNPQDGGPIYVDAGASPNLYAAHLLVFPTSNP